MRNEISIFLDIDLSIHDEIEQEIGDLLYFNVSEYMTETPPLGGNLCHLVESSVRQNFFIGLGIDRHFIDRHSFRSVAAANLFDQFIMAYATHHLQSNVREVFIVEQFFFARKAIVDGIRLQL